MTTDLPGLADRLTDLGLMDKAFADMELEDVEAMIGAVVASIEANAMPYLENGVLMVPGNAPEECKYWKRPWPESTSCLERVLKGLQADDETMRRYLGGSQ